MKHLAVVLLVVLGPLAAEAQDRAAPRMVLADAPGVQRRSGLQAGQSRPASPVRLADDGQQGTVRQGPRPALPREPVLRGYFMTDFVSMAASESFDAALGTSRLTMRGGGGEVLNIWRGVFARAAYSSGSESGSRVAVFDDEVVPLDIPLTVEVSPLEIGGGWRFRPFAGGHLVPYAGAAVLRVGYRERSDFASADDDIDETFSGRAIFAGIEAVIGGWVIAGAEVQHRSVPDALGDGGASEAFNERDLGGVAVRVLLGIRR